MPGVTDQEVVFGSREDAGRKNPLTAGQEGKGLSRKKRKGFSQKRNSVKECVGSRARQRKRICPSKRTILCCTGGKSHFGRDEQRSRGDIRQEKGGEVNRVTYRPVRVVLKWIRGRGEFYSRRGRKESNSASSSPGHPVIDGKEEGDRETDFGSRGRREGLLERKQATGSQRAEKGVRSRGSGNRLALTSKKTV